MTGCAHRLNIEFERKSIVNFNCRILGLSNWKKNLRFAGTLEIVKKEKSRFTNVGECSCGPITSKMASRNPNGHVECRVGYLSLETGRESQVGHAVFQKQALSPAPQSTENDLRGCFPSSPNDYS